MDIPGIAVADLGSRLIFLSQNAEKILFYARVVCGDAIEDQCPVVPEYAGYPSTAVELGFGDRYHYRVDVPAGPYGIEWCVTKIDSEFKSECGIGYGLGTPFVNDDCWFNTTESFLAMVFENFIVDACSEDDVWSNFNLITYSVLAIALLILLFTLVILRLTCYVTESRVVVGSLMVLSALLSVETVLLIGASDTMLSIVTVVNVIVWVVSGLIIITFCVHHANELSKDRRLRAVSLRSTERSDSCDESGDGYP